MSLLRLIESSNRATFEHEVISLSSAGSLGARLQENGIRVRALGLQRNLPNPVRLFRLIPLIRAAQPDLVHTWMYHANLLGGWAARRAGNRPLLWSIRQTNVDARSIRRLTIAIARLGGTLSRRWPDKIVCNATASRDAHVALGYDGDRFVIIPNGFDLEQFKPDAKARRSVLAELCLNDDALLVGLVARFDPQKDHRTFVRAASIAARRNVNLQFILCGEGVAQGNTTLMKWIRSAKIANKVHLLGVRSDLPRLMAALDVCVSSSIGEGFSNSIGEAMASGVPCAVTDVGDLAAIVSDTGRAVPPEDPPALAAALQSLADLEPAKRRALGARARERIRSEFSIDRMADRYAELYATMVSAAPASRRAQA